MWEPIPFRSCRYCFIICFFKMIMNYTTTGVGTTINPYLPAVFFPLDLNFRTASPSPWSCRSGRATTLVWNSRRPEMSATWQRGQDMEEPNSLFIICLYFVFYIGMMSSDYLYEWHMDDRRIENLLSYRWLSRSAFPPACQQEHVNHPASSIVGKRKCVPEACEFTGGNALGANKTLHFVRTK